MDIVETQESLLELVQAGEVFATPRLVEQRRVFVAALHATREDKEFTKVWLENPHFGLNS